ncbi:MAG: SPOR domain-containing protein [Desulfobacterales bacterium]|nr:SPOR domain-containing protein [Desulfobacterales bacterium]
MTHFLKHTALRIWASIALGAPVSLMVLPAIQARFGLGWAPLPAGLLLVAAFFLTGWALNRIGLTLAERRLREAGIWERSGEPHAAETAYADAVAIFDSFLISPRVRRHRSEHVTSRLARFYLARGEGDGRDRPMVTAYVRSHPEDREVADAWLRATAGVSTLGPLEQEAAHRIGEAHSDRPDIQLRLARLYLAARRTDFAALATYRRVFQQSDTDGSEMALALAELFLKEGRVDDWAMALYVQAATDGKGVDFLRGAAACVHWLVETSGNAQTLEKARKLVAGFDADALSRMRVGFVPPDTGEPEPEKSGVARMVSAGAKGAARVFSTMMGRMAAFAAAGCGKAASVLRRVGHSPRARRIMLWIGVAAAGAGILVFLVNTAGHLLQPRTRPAHTPIPAAAPVADRFTIQVAAYLKKVHAEKFVGELREKGIDAYWAEASGKNKQWFQVRIHHFSDKASARAYGESLKAKGIIDDFYVANYQLP